MPKADPIKKVAAKATIAYNSGNTAKINVLPKTLCPCPIAANTIGTNLSLTDS